jgi:hypothetical protein
MQKSIKKYLRFHKQKATIEIRINAYKAIRKQHNILKDEWNEERNIKKPILENRRKL